MEGRSFPALFPSSKSNKTALRFIPVNMGLLAKYTVSDIVFGGLVQLITLPYHRFFTYNTLRPAQEVAKHAQFGVARNGPDRKELYAVVAGWRSRKKDELQFVALAVGVRSKCWTIAQSQLTNMCMPS